MKPLSYRDYHFIVQGDSVLAHANALPYSENPYHFWQSCEIANQVHDLELSTLRCLTILEKDNLLCYLYAQEYLGGELPADWAWRKREDLASFESPFETQDLLQYWDSLSDTSQTAWYQQGFYASLAPLFPEKLEQLRSWERSAVWRLHGVEKQYLKLVPPMFQHEIPLCHWLQAHFPQHSAEIVPSPMGMLMADYGSDSLNQRQELLIWEEAMRVYARMQVGAIAYKDELLDLGLPLRPLDWLASRIEEFFADEAMLNGGLYPLSAEEIVKLRAAIPRLQEACERMPQYQIPDTLEHGDLWAGQIIVKGAQILTTDWSDSAWTNPLFSLVFFLAEIHNDLSKEPTAYEACKLAYLEQWQIYEPMPRLLEAFAEANLLSPLYTALRYYDDILPNMRQRWEMENMLGYNLRLLLKAVTTTAKD